MKEIRNQTFSKERDLFRIADTTLIECRFEGEEDGESPLKEGTNYILKDCYFKLRYPCWFAKNAHYENCHFDEPSRAPYWYCVDSTLKRIQVDGVKFLRECTNITAETCSFNSEEFGWRCNNCTFDYCQFNSQYAFFENKNLKLSNSQFKGKYSFQYNEDFVIENSVLDTKDAFWHAKRGVIKNCHVKGEYLAWYSEDLTFIDCIIEGTQPFVTCKNLKLINCQMINTDLAFEESDVDAEVTTPILSVKNPKFGVIKAPEIKEIILDEFAYKPGAKIIVG